MTPDTDTRQRNKTMNKTQKLAYLADLQSRLTLLASELEANDDCENDEALTFEQAEEISEHSKDMVFSIEDAMNEICV